MVELISWCVNWVPTILFVLILLTDTVIAYFRGFRKSLILLIHATVVFLILVGVYFLLVDTDGADKFLLQAINFFMGGDGALQRQLNVNENTIYLREVIVDGILANVPVDEGISLILKDNGLYLQTIVNFAYHIIFALVLYLLYLLLIGILFIVYKIFYSTKRYKKKLNNKFMNGKAIHTYKPHRKSAMGIGMFRGLVNGLISMSLIGSVFFIASGDLGNGTLDDKDYGDPNVNMYYSIYQSIDSYGSKGILKVLNSIRNKDDVPVYLFVADALLQGNISVENEETGGKDKYTLNLRSELGNYVNIAKNGLNLVAKYSDQELNDYIKGEMSQEEFSNYVLSLFSNEEFQSEFSIILDGIRDSDFVIDLAISLGCSIIANIDNMSFIGDMDPNVTELLKILFKKGHISKDIPLERELFALDNYKDIVLPYISPSYFIDKNDALTIVDCIFSIIQEPNPSVETIVRKSLPTLKKLSIMNDPIKSKEINKSFSRLYAFVENTYLTDAKPRDYKLSSYRSFDSLIRNDDVDYYEFLYGDLKIDWIDEIIMLVDCISDLDVVLDGIDFTSGSVDGLSFFESIFDRNNENYETKMASFNRVCETLENSRMIGEVLSSKMITSEISKMFQAFSRDFHMPLKMEYANSFDNEGNIIQYGELYNVLNGIRLLFDERNEELKDLLLNGSEFTDENMKTIYQSFNNKDDKNNSICDYFISSDLMQSLVSSVLIDVSKDGVIYIPEAVLQVDENGEKINIIEKNELSQVLNNLPIIYEELLPLVNDMSNIETLIDNPYFNKLLNNRIIQGTVSKYLLDFLGNSDFLVIPKRLESVDNWISSSNNKSELVELVEILQNTSLNLDEIIQSDGNFNSLLTKLISLNKEGKIGVLLDSDILRYTVSNVLYNLKIGDLEFVIPYGDTDILNKDNISRVIKNTSLERLLDTIDLLQIDLDAFDFENVLYTAISNRDEVLKDTIISSSIALYFNNKFGDQLYIPSSLIKHGSKAELTNYGDSNPWKQELPNLLDAVDELFEVTKNQGLVDFNNIEDTIYNTLDNYNETSYVDPRYNKLELLSNSKVITYTYGNYLDSNILIDSIITPEAKKLAKSEEVYRYEEISSLLDVIMSYNISIDNVNNFDFTNLTVNETIINFIKDQDFGSYLIRGLFTRQIQDILGGKGFRRHPLAYEDNLLKKPELLSLFDIIDTASLNTFDYDNYSITYFDNFIYDENGNCSSYLLAATISNFIMEDSNFAIPSECLEKCIGKFISTAEIHKILILCSSVLNIDNLSQINIDNINLNIDLFESDIMNATITKNLKINSTSGVLPIYIDRKYATLSEDARTGDKIIKIKIDEANNIIDTFTLINGNNSHLSLHLSIEYLISLDTNTLTSLLNCSIIHLAISDILTKEISPFIISNILGFKTFELPVIDLTNGEWILKDVYSQKNILSIISYLAK